MFEHDNWRPGDGWTMHDGWRMHDSGWGFWVMATIVVLVVLVPLLTALVLLVTRRGSTAHTSAGPWPQPPGRDERFAQRVLERRFAAGEIDEEELRARTEALRLLRE